MDGVVAAVCTSAFIARYSVRQFGFAPTLGSQAYHIIRCSVLTIMFMDPDQSYRERENTRLEELKQWAQELGVGEVTELDLSGAQFRCAGSAEYVDWVEGLLRGDPASRNRVRAGAWRYEWEDGDSVVVPMQRVAQPAARYVASRDTESANARRFRAPFEFLVMNDPEELEAALRKRMAEGRAVRLLSSFSRPWITDDSPNPHALPAELKDFNVPYTRDGVPRTWSRIWNYAPKGDYTWFVQARSGGRMAEDPLCEVGCPYVVRGFDYDYLGILWLDDLVWRNGRWEINLDALHETGVLNLTRRARHERAAGGEGPAMQELRKRTAQAYRILMTRALRGINVWILDPETRAHVQASLGS